MRGTDDWKLFAVREAYEMYLIGRRTLEACTEGIVREMRRGAQLYIDNPKYNKQDLGQQIIDGLKDADIPAMVKKYKGKVERERKQKRHAAQRNQP